jgi:tetratricopeptide (TPR) repeat protein
MLREIRQIPESVRITLVGACALSAVLLIETRPWRSSVDGHFEEQLQTAANEVDAPEIPPEPLVDPDMENTLRADTAKSIKEIDPQLEVLMAQKRFGELSNRLLNMAASIIEANQPNQLAELLSLLGQVSIEQQNLDAAEVYLFEALDLLKESSNEGARAEIYMQLGRAHLRSREIARSAGYAYDALLIGRNQLMRGRYQVAELNILKAIEQNLSINRYNAAASAYSSLALLKERIGNRYEAEQSRLEAARLYASSGQLSSANRQITMLRASGIEEWRLLGIENEIDTNYRTYKESIEQIALAKDYRRLYHHYLSKNNHARAWHFRLLASKSLEKVSKRAMFHRQQGVLALLYNSNAAMALAKNYFSEASQSFVNNGMVELEQQTRALNSQVY